MDGETADVEPLWPTALLESTAEPATGEQGFMHDGMSDDYISIDTDTASCNSESFISLSAAPSLITCDDVTVAADIDATVSTAPATQLKGAPPYAEMMELEKENEQALSDEAEKEADRSAAHEESALQGTAASSSWLPFQSHANTAAEGHVFLDPKALSSEEIPKRILKFLDPKDLDPGIKQEHVDAPVIFSDAIDGEGDAVSAISELDNSIEDVVYVDSGKAISGEHPLAGDALTSVGGCGVEMGVAGAAPRIAAGERIIEVASALAIPTELQLRLRTIFRQANESGVLADAMQTIAATSAISLLKDAPLVGNHGIIIPELQVRLRTALVQALESGNLASATHSIALAHAESVLHEEMPHVAAKADPEVVSLVDTEVFYDPFDWDANEPDSGKALAESCGMGKFETRGDGAFCIDAADASADGGSSKQIPSASIYQLEDVSFPSEANPLQEAGDDVNGAETAVMQSDAREPLQEKGSEAYDLEVASFPSDADTPLQKVFYALPDVFGAHEATPPAGARGSESREVRFAKYSTRRHACKYFCLVVVLLAIAGLIMLFCCIHTLDPDEQVVVHGPDFKYAKNGPAIVVLSPFRKKEFRRASVLGQLEYAIVKNLRTMQVHNAAGPGLLWLGAYDEVQGIEKKKVLQQHEYIRLLDRRTGVERVVSGPTVFVPGPFEEAPDGIRQAIVLGLDASAIVMNKITGVLHSISNPGLIKLEPYEVLKEVRAATLLGPKEYASVKSSLTGEYRHEIGPQLLKIGAYDQITRIKQKFVLRKDEYIKLQDQRTGMERVLSGPQTVVPKPFELAARGIQRAAFLDADSAVVVLNRKTGHQRLVAEKLPFIPVPYEEIVDTRSAIRLMPHEAVVVKDVQGKLTVHRGSGSHFQSIFLEPHSRVVEMMWSSLESTEPTASNDTSMEQTASNDTRETSDENRRLVSTTKVPHTKIDLRVKRTPFSYDVRTSDSVRLKVYGTIFWRIANVEAMIRTTSDPEADVWLHSRSSLLRVVSRTTLSSFMNTFNTIIAEAVHLQEHTDGFYKDRGVELESIELTKYECANHGIAVVLQQIIEEKTNRINRLQVQQSYNEINAFSLKADIILEKQRTELILNKATNTLLEAEAEGDIKGLRRVVAANIFIGGLNQTVPNIEQRVDLYKLQVVLRSKNAITKDLASSKATLFLSLKDVNISFESTKIA